VDDPGNSDHRDYLLLSAKNCNPTEQDSWHQRVERIASIMDFLVRMDFVRNGLLEVNDSRK
jgi:hypothetical protein